MALTRTNDNRVDELEAAMYSAAMSDDNDIDFVFCPLNHYFLPNLYVREILMPAGSIITSEVHKTRHPFVVLEGIVSVIIDDEKQLIEAPFVGITEEGTRRVLHIQTNTVWRTFHTLEYITGYENGLGHDEMMKVVDRVISDIIEPYENKLLGGRLFLNQLTKTITE